MRIPEYQYPHVQRYVTELCEHLDAGIYSGDMLDTCDMVEFQDYVYRWQGALAKHRITKLEQRVAELEASNEPKN